VAILTPGGRGGRERSDVWEGIQLGASEEGQPVPDPGPFAKSHPRGLRMDHTRSHSNSPVSFSRRLPRYTSTRHRAQPLHAREAPPGAQPGPSRALQGVQH